jgi:hypothetical protein
VAPLEARGTALIVNIARPPFERSKGRVPQAFHVDFPEYERGDKAKKKPGPDELATMFVILKVKTRGMDISCSWASCHHPIPTCGSPSPCFPIQRCQLDVCPYSQHQVEAAALLHNMKGLDSSAYVREAFSTQSGATPWLRLDMEARVAQQRVVFGV